MTETAKAQAEPGESLPVYPPESENGGVGPDGPDIGSVDEEIGSVTPPWHSTVDTRRE